MSCPAELTLSRYVDGALGNHDGIAVAQHLRGCVGCQARLDFLTAETHAIRTALAQIETPALPPFRYPVAIGPVVAAGLAIAGFVALVLGGPAMFGAWVPAPVAEFNPLDAWAAVELAWRAVFFVSERGEQIVVSIMQTVTAMAVLGFVAWVLSAVRRAPSVPLLMVCFAIAAGTLAAPVEALEIRRSDDGTVLLRAGETVADTLVAVGNTVEIDGDVEGDLIAFGRRVIVRGRVGGQIFTAAQNVSVEGEVGGSILAFAQTLDILSKRVGRNLFGFASAMNLASGGGVEDNALAFGKRVHFSGTVGRDIMAFGEEIEVGNAVGGSITAYAQQVTLLAPARVNGNVRLHLVDEDRLVISPSAVIGGEVITELRKKTQAEESRYSTGGYYLGQLWRFAAAFVTGVVVLLLVPGLRRASLDTGSAALLAGGVGAIALVATPILAVLVAVTLIGLPVALLTLVVWLAGIYLAKILLAHFIGARLIPGGDTRHFAAALALGLASVVVLINLPFIGGIMNFALTICGLGMLLLYGWQAFREPNTPVETGRDGRI